MITVSIISPKVSLQAINKVIDNEDFGCIFHKYIYERLEDIPEIYYKCREHCDVIFCSGELGYHHLIKIKGMNTPCSFVSYEEKHILSILLSFVITHPDIPLSRVYCDFLTPANHYMNIEKYLPEGQMLYCFNSDIYNYDYLLARADELWTSGRIDIMLTRSTNLLPKYDEKEIPYIHILPGSAMISESIHNAVNGVKLLAARELPKIHIILRLFLPDDMTIEEKEYLEVTLHQRILEFRKINSVSLSVRALADRLELSGDSISYRKSLKTLQLLISFLQEKESVEFRLGAGIGANADDSHYHAELALQESIKYGKNDGFLSDGETSALTGPLTMANSLTYSYLNQKVLAYSREYGIHESNLLKIAGLFQMNEQEVITAPDLAPLLNITTRSCNRILLQLLASNLIVELEPQKSAKKGRPIRRYRFNKKVCEDIFF